MASVTLYDTTLRDGSQMEGVSLSVHDKLRIAERLDQLGVHFIEGGWPGSNPKDEEFFREAKSLNLAHAKLTAFGSTRRANSPVQHDANIRALLDSGAEVVTLVGKASEMQVSEVLEAPLEENLAMIRDSIAYLRRAGEARLLRRRALLRRLRGEPGVLTAVHPSGCGSRERSTSCCATRTAARCPWTCSRP